MSTLATAEAPRVPYISKLPRMMVKSSDYELIRKLRSEYESAWAANEKEFAMLFKAWRYAFAGEGDQWDYEAWKYKQERGMRAGQYNVIGPKVDTYAGSIIADKFDHRYDPEDGVRSSGIEAIENAYYTDKERCDYEENWNLFIIDAVIHLGILECKVGTKYSRRGNIYFQRALPGRWVFDPYWKTSNDRECMKSFKQANFTLQQLFEQFRKLPHTAKLDELIKYQQRLGMSWTERQLDEYNKKDPSFENAYHTIEAHWVENIHTKRLIYYDDMGNATPFPVTEDNEKLELFAMQNGITDWNESVDVVPYDDKVHYSAAFCTELFPYNLLDYGKPEIQGQGLPTIQLTMHKDPSGRNKGIPHDLIDPQKDINYNKSKVQEYLASALGGAIVYDKRKIPNEIDQQDFERNHNDPMKSFGIEGNPSDFVRNLRDNQVNPELIRQATEAIDLIDRLSGKSAAMEAKTQGASEPAALYEMKLRVDKIGDLPVLSRVKQARIRQAEMYYIQSQISYADAERRFTSKDGKREAVLNERVMVQGRPGIRNKVEDLPLSSVTISEAPDNLTRQMRLRTEISSIIKSVPPEDRETMSIAINELLKTVKMSDEVKDKLDQSMKLNMVLGKMQKMSEMAGMEANMSQSKLISAQAMMELQQLMAQVGQPTQGAPPPEEMITPEGESNERLPEQISPEGGMEAQPNEIGVAPAIEEE